MWDSLGSTFHDGAGSDPALARTIDEAHADRFWTELGDRTGVGAHNAATRERAARMVELGYAGLVSGHTHSPELSVVGDGFYANSGCGVEVLGPMPARLGLPRPFVSVRSKPWTSRASTATCRSRPWTPAFR